jgi:hypothetical protein
MRTHQSCTQIGTAQIRQMLDRARVLLIANYTITSKYRLLQQGGKESSEGYLGMALFAINAIFPRPLNQVGT